MQSRAARRLRESWGAKPCEHPRFDKEYDFGAQTGDYVCVQCGRDFSPSAVSAIEAGRRPDRPAT